jgi:hypothetical protein
LIVDGNIPNFLKSKKTVYYSALYNYIPDQLKLQLSSGITVAGLVGGMSGISINTSESNFDSK